MKSRALLAGHRSCTENIGSVGTPKHAKNGRGKDFASIATINDATTMLRPLAVVTTVTAMCQMKNSQSVATVQTQVQSASEECTYVVLVLSSTASLCATVATPRTGHMVRTLASDVKTKNAELSSDTSVNRVIIEQPTQADQQRFYKRVRSTHAAWKQNILRQVRSLLFAARICPIEEIQQCRRTLRSQAIYHRLVVAFAILLEICRPKFATAKKMEAN